MDINSFARTLHAAPRSTLKWVAFEDGSPVQLPKTTANPRTQPVAYLAQAQKALESHRDNVAIKDFIAGELRTLNASAPVALEDLGPMAAVYEALRRECAACALDVRLAPEATSLADLGRVYAALSEREFRCIDVPVLGDAIFDGFMRDGMKPQTFERLKNTAASLYDYVQRHRHPEAASYGKALAKATRDADPKVTNAFFDLLDRFR